MKTAIDANILFDTLSGTTEEAAAAEAALLEAGSKGALILSSVCYAELAARFHSLRDLDDFLDGFQLQYEEMSAVAAHRAGKMFREYRRRGGPRTRILPDFLVAAHAEVHADVLLTRDKRFFSMKMMKLKVIAPSHTF